MERSYKAIVGVVVFILMIIIAVFMSTEGVARGSSIENQSTNKFTEADAIGKLADKYPDFPARAGSITISTRLPGGDAGAMADVNYITEVKEIQKGVYNVVLTKDWNTNVNGQDVISYWKYEITSDKTSLLESGSNEYLLNIMK